MSRLPVRVRLTLAFTLAMAIVLSGIGALLYVRLGDSLREQLDDSLSARAESVAALVRAGAGELPSGDEDGFAQAVDGDGSLVASSTSVAGRPVLSEAEIERARSGSLLLVREGLPGLGGSAARLLVTPIHVQDQELTLVVGASLDDRAEALGGLLNQLLIVGPLALLASALAGYFLAGAALRPVEAMRRRAAAISTEQLADRLPLPRAHDEIHRLGSTLNAMLDRLEAGVARERRFVADASHELRTPLALLQTELELALRHPRSREELESALSSAAEEVDRLTRLAEDLLVLARADEGHLVLHRAAVPTRDLLDALAQRFAARATGAGRALEVSMSGPERFVADRVRLEQALGNLLDNALRHGGGTIRLQAENHEGETELLVSDEGAGFPVEFLPRAFDRFSRGDEARGGGSSGLGLAIVATVARAHGGSASAANAAAGGAVVTLRLPGGTTAEVTREARGQGGGSPAVIV